MPDTTNEDHTYIAELPHRCYRCTATSKKRGDYKDAPQSDALVIWPVELKG